MKRIVALAAALAAVVAFAYDWDSITVEGVATIPSGVTAIVTDEDAAKVAALTAINAADTTSRLVFNTTTSITVNADITLSGGSAAAPALDFASAGHVTFKGDLVGKTSSNANTFFNLGNMTAEAMFGEGASQYTRLNLLSGMTSVVARTATVRERYWQYLSGDGTIRLETPLIASKGYQWSGSHTVIMACENALTATYEDGSLGASGGLCIKTLVLDGCDQSIPYIAWYYLDVPTSAKPQGDGRRIVITSATPATLSYRNFPATGTLTNSLEFTGKAKYELNMPDRRQAIVFFGAESEDNDLLVTAGTLELAWSAGWAGTNVTVGAAGELVCNSKNALTNVNAVVTIKEGGKLFVPAGVTAQASKYVFGDTTFKTPGVYTVAQIAELDFGDYVGGEGNLSVELSGEFEWPEPGEIAYLPKGTTVVVTDGERAQAESVGGFTLFEGSSLVVSNITEGLTLNAPIVGSGRLEVWDSTNVVFAADNSTRAGAFFVTNSEVITAHRYGFGSSVSPAIEFWTGDAGRLRFRGAGLTNDVAIGVKDTGIAELPPLAFYEGPDNVIVQNGDLLFKRFNYTKLTLANLVCNGKFGRDSGNTEQLEINRFQTVPNTLLAFNGWFNPGYTFNPQDDVTIRLGEENCTGWFPAFRIYPGDRIVCDARNALDPDGILYIYGATSVVDLNGYDQTIGTINNTAAVSEGNVDKALQNYTSATAAALTVNAVDDQTIAAKFDGEAGLTFNGGAFAYAIANVVSPTKGVLTVSSGTLTFKWAAGWQGRVALAGGTLVIDESAVATAFSRKTTDLVLGDGKLTVPAGQTVSVRSAKQANGEFLAPGTYTPVNCTFLTAGSGSVFVRRDTDQKTGLILFVR